MRDLRALSAASDSHHLVSFKDNLFVHSMNFTINFIIFIIIKLHHLVSFKDNLFVCLTIIKSPGKTCDLFPWQKQEFMSTQYDHVEL